MYVAKIELTPSWWRKKIGGKFSSQLTRYDKYTACLIPPTTDDEFDVALLVAYHRIRSHIIIDEYHY